MEFTEALDRFGFRRVEDRRTRGGVRVYEAKPNPFMTLSVHVYADGTALFTWEFAVAEYLSGRGIQIGDGEVLNLFMYPAGDERGPQEAAWLTAVIDRTDALLRSVDFARPSSP
jgi:hypothetical protein